MRMHVYMCVRESERGHGCVVCTSPSRTHTPAMRRWYYCYQQYSMYIGGMGADHIERTKLHSGMAADTRQACAPWFCHTTVSLTGSSLGATTLLDLQKVDFTHLTSAQIQTHAAQLRGTMPGATILR